MAGKAQELGGPIRVADYLSLGLLARLAPPTRVDEALTEHGRHSQRQRDLPAPATRKKRNDPQTPALTVRVIDYHLPGLPQSEPIYRRITPRLDPHEAPAEELAALYQSRWTIESTFGEMKTTLKGAAAVLRSKTPELVRQEFWGMLLAHYVVRKLMLEAALARTRSPDRLSFKHALTLIRRKLPASGALPP
jgi:IS4 transposase